MNFHLSSHLSSLTQQQPTSMQHENNPISKLLQNKEAILLE